MPQDVRFVEARGQRVPAVGLGTWQLEGQECRDAVGDALGIGYRHIDTAQAYDNEREVGEAIRASGVDRDEIWVTSKVWWENLSRPECIASARRSCERLGLDRIDLMLVHWPDEDLPLEEPLGCLEELRDEGVIRQLGVSNFTPTLFTRALELAPLFCIQVEYHPFLAQHELRAIARENDVILTAYSPIAQGQVMDDPTLRAIGNEHAKSPAQVALRWLLQQRGVAAIPRSSSPAHRRDNFDIFDFELSDEQMERIWELDEGMRLIDPEFAPAWEH